MDPELVVGFSFVPSSFLGWSIQIWPEFFKRLGLPRSSTYKSTIKPLTPLTSPSCQPWNKVIYVLFSHEKNCFFFFSGNDEPSRWLSCFNGEVDTRTRHASLVPALGQCFGWQPHPATRRATTLESASGGMEARNFPCSDLFWGEVVLKEPENDWISLIIVG